MGKYLAKCKKEKRKRKKPAFFKQKKIAGGKNRWNEEAVYEIIKLKTEGRCGDTCL